MNDAFASVHKALELDPNDPEAHRIMGAVKLLFEGDMDTAIFHHQKELKFVQVTHITSLDMLFC